jgi:hypothetical protein
VAGGEVVAEAARSGKVFDAKGALDAKIDHHLRETERHTNVSQLRRSLVIDCAGAQAGYTTQCIPPSASHDACVAVASRLRESWELICGAAASPADRRSFAWHQSQLKTNMAGAGVTNPVDTRGGAYAASVLTCWPTLQRVAPKVFGTLDIGDTSIDMLKEVHSEYYRLDAAARGAKGVRHPGHRRHVHRHAQGGLQ